MMSMTLPANTNDNEMSVSTALQLAFRSAERLSSNPNEGAKSFERLSERESSFVDSDGSLHCYKVQSSSRLDRLTFCGVELKFALRSGAYNFLARRTKHARQLYYY